MNEITLLLFVVTLAFFVLMYVLKKERNVAWLTLFAGVCSIGATITDETLTDWEGLFLIVLAFYAVLIAGTNTMVGRN